MPPALRGRGNVAVKRIRHRSYDAGKDDSQTDLADACGPVVAPVAAAGAAAGAGVAAAGAGAAAAGAGAVLAAAAS